LTCLVVCKGQLPVHDCLSTILDYRVCLGWTDKRSNMTCVETSCSQYGARVGITAATSAPLLLLHASVGTFCPKTLWARTLRQSLYTADGKLTSFSVYSCRLQSKYPLVVVAVFLAKGSTLCMMYKLVTILETLFTQAGHNTRKARRSRMRKVSIAIMC
jgi:hypothetical protein